jgi:hypothetical protein
MASQTVYLDYNNELEIIVPGGRKVMVLPSYLEPEEQLRKIDIKFDADLALNCFGEGLRLAKATEHGRHILEGPQIIVPMDRPAAPQRCRDQPLAPTLRLACERIARS